MFKPIGRGAEASGKSRVIKGWVAEFLPLGPETSILVSELQCSEPGCPPIETVIALLEGKGAPRQFKVHRPMAEVSREDVIRALRAEHGGHAESKEAGPGGK